MVHAVAIIVLCWEVYYSELVMYRYCTLLQPHNTLIMTFTIHFHSHR